MLTLSLIIPVYNEERQIAACLDAVAAQTVAPTEVIVVDNNCTDATIAIAKRYPFVRVVKEAKQGRAHARSAGFAAANGAILGRIDADSRLQPDWVERVIAHFNADQDLQALSGIAWTDLVPYTHKIKTTMFARSYYWGINVQFRTITLWGATMAVRKKAWQQIAQQTINDDSLVHEDQDLSLWLAAKGMKLAITPDVRIVTTGQTYRYLPKLVAYTWLQYKTKQLHKRNGNLSSKHLPKLTLLPLLPGFVAGLPFGLYLVVGSIITYPIDRWLLYRRGHILR